MTEATEKKRRCSTCGAYKHPGECKDSYEDLLVQLANAEDRIDGLKRLVNDSLIAQSESVQRFTQFSQEEQARRAQVKALGEALRDCGVPEGLVNSIAKKASDSVKTSQEQG